MTTSAVRLEVLPTANKLRYEKSLIGQLFSSDGKDSSTKAKSPTVVRAKTDFKPEPKQDAKLNTKLEVRRPDQRAKTPEPAAVNTPPAELQSGHGSLERASPTAPARAASSSPTPRTPSHSPLPSKSPVMPSLTNLTTRKAGKRIKIDLKKGKCAAEYPFNFLLGHYKFLTGSLHYKLWVWALKDLTWQRILSSCIMGDLRRINI